MKHIFLLLMVLTVLGLRAENRVLHTLYTKDDGLSQNRVMDIEQDHKGFMWFATWDGLNRFDGKQFRVYKGVPGDPEGPDNNRFLSVQTDAFGYLWLLNGTGEVFRFNPETEQFKRFSFNPATQTGLIKHAINRMLVLKQNKVALLTISGCYLFRINPDGSIGKSMFLSRVNGSLANDWIREAVADGLNDVWFLTNSGLTNYNYTFNRSQHYFNQAANQEAFSCLLQVEERLYFGTESGRVWYKERSKTPFEGGRISSTSPITAMVSLPGNRLIMSTQGDGLYITDAKLKVLDHITTASHPELGSNRVHSLYADMDGTIWLDAEVSGFVYYDVQKNKLHRYLNPYKTEFSGTSDRSGLKVIEGKGEYCWLYSRNGGLYSCDRKSKTIQPINMTDVALGAQNLSLLTDAMVDKDGNLWFSSGEPRLEKITVEPHTFLYTPVASIQKQKDGAEVRTIFEDGKKRIWVCDKEGKIQLMDKNRRTLGWLKPDGTLSSTVYQTDMMVYDMIQDKKGRYWLACKGVGVVLLQEKKNNTPSFSIKYLNRETTVSSRPNSTLCYALLEDPKGRIWVGTFGGGLNLVKETKDSILFMHARKGLITYPLETFPNIRDLAIDNMGIIWVATDNGLVAFDSNITDPSTIIYHSYRRNGSIPGSLRTNDVHCIYIDRQNNRWFGTFGGGLNVLDGAVKPGDKTSFRSYSQKDGLPSDIILSIEEDFKGNLWLLSENGITRFDTKTGSKDVYNKDYGLEPVMFAESPTLISHTGEIYAGTMKGYYRFNPSMVKKAEFTSPLYFTGLFLFDEEITPTKSYGILKENLDKANRIVLKNNQSVFSIEFAAIDFRNPKNIQYAYKLEPVDNDWVIINKSNRITFSRLVPSEYTLVVRSTNSEGVWMNNERRLKIVVKPSPWQTGWAIALYAILGLLMLYYLHRSLLDKFKSKNKESVDKEVVEAKKQFLATVSRELRAPLMLMEGPVEQLSNDKGLSFDSKNNLSILKRNIERMIRLITRILEFQKKQEHKMTLMVEEISMGGLCEKTADYFKIMAQERGINFVYTDQSNGMNVYLDKEKIDTILHILLSNALRFTKGGKTISLHVKQKENGLVVIVADEGTGISKENLPFIFEQLNVMEETDEESGMGIGLSLAKELVELHKGTIQVSSQKGVGTTFELFFKLGKVHFANSDVVLFQPEFLPGEMPEVEAIACLDKDVYELNQQQLIMVVESQPNQDVSISSFLTHRFRVASIRYTPLTWSDIDRLMPDFVIIDNDAHVEDSLHLIEQLKGSERTCHIPIILAAHKPVEPLSSGEFPEGVEDLISKPFNASYLEARLEQIVVRRSKWCEQLRKDVLDATAHSFFTTVSLEPFDAAFLGRVMDFIKENMSNSELTVNMLISVIGLGKSPFVNKLRSLLVLSPFELIREVRLKHAMTLLESGRFNVSEVVLQVGMKDVNAFSKCFLQHVGVTPYEYRGKAATLQK